MTLYDNEENAVVNNPDQVSETPSDLVAEGEGKELSPNPANSGFVKQLFVDSLPASGQVNTLYLLSVKNDGALVGHKKYKWNPSDGWVFCGVTPDLKLTDSPREQKAVEVNAPKKNLAQVFNGDVAIVGGKLYIDGKEAGQGGGGGSADDPDAIHRIEVTDIEAIPDDVLISIKKGDVVVDTENDVLGYVIYTDENFEGNGDVYVLYRTADAKILLKYHLVSDTFELTKNILEYAKGVGQLESDEVACLIPGSIVTNGSEVWVVSQANTLYCYLYKITGTSDNRPTITLCRFVYDDAYNGGVFEWHLDLNYGYLENGYEEHELGGDKHIIEVNIAFYFADSHVTLRSKYLESDFFFCFGLTQQLTEALGQPVVISGSSSFNTFIETAGVQVATQLAIMAALANTYNYLSAEFITDDGTDVKYYTIIKNGKDSCVYINDQGTITDFVTTFGTLVASAVSVNGSIDSDGSQLEVALD